MSPYASTDGRPAESGLERYRHICVLYHGPDEEYQVLSPFIAAGFANGDKAFHIIDGTQRAEHLRRLRQLGVDVEATERDGQLEVRGWEAAHLRPGWFDQHAMLGLVEEVLTEARTHGFPFTRWVANMGWALGGCRGADDLAEYCSRLNRVVPNHQATIVCTYDLARFTARAVVEVLRTHPVAIIGGVLHENPFYVPPEALLREQTAREGEAGGAGQRRAAGV